MLGNPAAKQQNYILAKSTAHDRAKPLHGTPNLPPSPPWSSWAPGPQQALANTRQGSAWHQACIWWLGWTMNGEGQWRVQDWSKKNTASTLPTASCFPKLCFLWPYQPPPILCTCHALCLESPSPPCVHGNNIYLVTSSCLRPKCLGQGQAQTGCSLPPHVCGRNEGVREGGNDRGTETRLPSLKIP